jgi:hypothetical protein
VSQPTSRVCPSPALSAPQRLGGNEHACIVRKVPQHFGYAIDKRYLPVVLPFLLRPARDGVTLTDEDSFVASFGLVKIATPRSNISGAHITRNYRWWTAVGVRMSRADDGLTFGTNHNAGVCIHFAERVPSPLRRSGHSALTVTVADLEGLTTALGGDNEEPASSV